MQCTSRMAKLKLNTACMSRAEEYYSLEDVFGRDVSSVFPKQASCPPTVQCCMMLTCLQQVSDACLCSHKTQAKNEASTSGPDADAIREMLGARKFISETEVCCVGCPCQRL